ncbi:MAG: SGNH/GDSL hydrolase family protein, partial [Myxococcales bacterium]|nr:SGNH/GDSL hydrolase family protein [Myxococcales bacterium]
EPQRSLSADAEAPAPAPEAPTSVASTPRAAAPSATASAAPAGRRYLVAAMGDSLTDPRSHGGKYLEFLQQKCPQSRFDSYGVGGNMVNQMRKRFARDILGEPPDPEHPKPAYTHLLVLGGINDICSDESALRTNDKIKADLSAMYAAGKAEGMTVIAVTLPPWGGFTRYYNPRRAESTRDMNRWLLGRAEAGEVDRVFDVHPLLSCGDPELLCDDYGWPDKVHWSKEGHRVVADAMHAALFQDCL